MKRAPKGMGNYTKSKSGKYCLRVQVTQYADGTLINEDGKPITKRFYGQTKTECSHQLKDWQSTFLAQKSTPQSVKFLDDYMERWFELYKKNTVKATTQNVVVEAIQRLKKYDIADKKISKLTAADLQLFINGLNDEKYSRSTIYKEYVYLKQCLDHAVKVGDLQTNPMLAVKMPSSTNIQAEQTERHILDADDMEVLYDYLITQRSGQDSYGPHMIFLMYTGLRIGEALALQNSDIYLEDKPYIDVTKDYTMLADHTQVIGPPKTRQAVRHIPLSARALEAVKLIQAGNVRQRPKDNLFQTRTGNHPELHNLRRQLNNLLHHAGTQAEHITLHELRHTCISYWVRRGLQPKVVSELAGHKDITTTLNYYTHTSEDEKFDAISWLE